MDTVLAKHKEVLKELGYMKEKVTKLEDKVVKLEEKMESGKYF